MGWVVSLKLAFRLGFVWLYDGVPETGDAGTAGTAQALHTDHGSRFYPARSLHVVKKLIS